MGMSGGRRVEEEPSVVRMGDLTCQVAQSPLWMENSRPTRRYRVLMGAVPIFAPPPDVDVRRSRRRLRTVTAYREGDRTVVLIPARFTTAQEQEWVRRMLARLSAQDRRRRPGDDDLATRAGDLSRRYLGGLAPPPSGAW